MGAPIFSGDQSDPDLVPSTLLNQRNHVEERLLDLGQARFVLCHFRKVYSGFNTVFLPLLLLAAGVGFPAACF